MISPGLLRLSPPGTWGEARHRPFQILLPFWPPGEAGGTEGCGASGQGVCSCFCRIFLWPMTELAVPAPAMFPVRFGSGVLALQRGALPTQGSFSNLSGISHPDGTARVFKEEYIGLFRSALSCFYAFCSSLP